MGKINQFEDLVSWREARKLIKLVYELSGVGPPSRDFDMKSQFRRAAISTMNNIAEGFGRFSKKERIRYLEISSASADEIRSMSYAAVDLGYWTEDQAKIIRSKAQDVKSLDLGFIRYLNSH